MTGPQASSDPWSRVTTVNGLRADEVRSMVQKAIRRGWLEEAVLAAYELYASGPEAEELLWTRLFIIAVEDIGFGLVEAPAILEALASQRLRFARGGERFMFVAHAIRLLTLAKKDRTSSELESWTIEHVENGIRIVDVHDVAVDMHTARGVEQGRGLAHFLTEGTIVEPEIEDRDTTWGDWLRQRHVPDWQSPSPDTPAGAVGEP